ncbi:MULTISPECIES: hypothetical protein [Cohnella]|jgi:hypothetical protein|uniref:hypothetical protein n=1 Tax=Cohnella TaxID=329857 RepID=UPI000382C7EA|nr:MULTISPECIES: hypothetical protein [Cohnella]REK67496.1 MAG: hypothetical protein C6P35_04700 [Cohnella sp.]
MNNVWFVLFSTIEATSIYTIMLTIFRYNTITYIKQIVPISILMSILSWAIWNELNISQYAPIISVVIFVIFIFYILRISLLGAALVVGTGYAAYAVVQTLLLAVFQSLGLLSIENVQSNKPDLYVLQSASALILFFASYVLYKKGYGFTFPLERFSWKSWRLENQLVLVVLILSLIFISVVSLLRNRLYMAWIVFTIMFCFLIYLGNKKEKI